MILFCAQIWAFSTIIPTYIRVDTTISSQPSSFNGNIPSGPRRVHFVNHATELPKLELAMEEASKIFTASMLQNWFPMMDIYAEVSLDDLGPDSSIVCEVDVVYSDTIDNLENYPRLSSLMYGSSYNVLVPMALSNQTRGLDQNISMFIKLRNNVTFHISTDSATNYSYDATTILLLALAKGCGIQSTFNRQTLDVGILDGSTRYINAYDAQIYNENNHTLSNIADGTISAFNFFNGKAIYALGYDEDLLPKTIHLKNILENSPNTPSPFASIRLDQIAMDVYTEDDIENELIDLLDPELTGRECIREVTPYTLDLLRGIGWMYDIPLGNNLFAPLHNSIIQCSSSVLLPNNTYTITTTGSGVSYSNMVCEIESFDSTYVIANINPYTKTFSYSSLPDDVQWKRNSITKNIIGRIKANAYMFIDGTYKSMQKSYEIEIPYRPNRPLVNRNETSDNNYIYLDLSAFANGSETYTITYVGLTDMISHSFNVTQYSIDTVLLLPATQYYDITIYGSNTNGVSNSFSFTAGASIQPEYYLNLSVFGNSLYYTVTSSNPNFPSSINVGAITISSLIGSPLIYTNASIGDEIDISSLPRRNYYLFSTTINGQVYSKRFYKR